MSLARKGPFYLLDLLNTFCPRFRLYCSPCFLGGLVKYKSESIVLVLQIQMMGEGVEEIVEAKLNYHGHLQRINRIAAKNTATTKDIVKHQLQMNEFIKFKDLSRQFAYKRKMDELLKENSKIYGNLAKIVHKQPSKNIILSEKNQIERQFLSKKSERIRVLGLLDLEKDNLKIADKLSRAKKSINFNQLEHEFQEFKKISHHMRKFDKDGNKMVKKANEVLMSTALNDRLILPRQTSLSSHRYSSCQSKRSFRSKHDGRNQNNVTSEEGRYHHNQYGHVGERARSLNHDIKSRHNISGMSSGPSKATDRIHIRIKTMRGDGFSDRGITRFRPRRDSSNTSANENTHHSDDAAIELNPDQIGILDAQQKTLPKAVPFGKRKQYNQRDERKRCPEVDLNNICGVGVDLDYLGEPSHQEPEF